MNTSPSPAEKDPPAKQASSEAIQTDIYPYRYEINIADGCEFLDGDIRMKDQPFYETTVKEDK